VSAPRCRIYPDPLAAAGEPLPPPAPGETLAAWLGRVAPGQAAPPGVVVDGAWRELDDLPPRASACIEVYPAVGKVLRRLRRSISRRLGFDLLGLALTAAAAIIVPPSLGLTAGTLAFAAAAAVAATATGLLLDAIAPLAADATLPGELSAGGGGEAYAIDDVANRARPYQRLPLLLGRMRVTPDLVLLAQGYRSDISDLALFTSRTERYRFVGGAEPGVYRHSDGHIITGVLLCEGARQQGYSAAVSRAGAPAYRWEDSQGMSGAVDRLGARTASNVDDLVRALALGKLLPVLRTDLASGKHPNDALLPILAAAQITPGGAIDFSAPDDEYGPIELESPKNRNTGDNLYAEITIRHLVYYAGNSGPEAAPEQTASQRLQGWAFVSVTSRPRNSGTGISASPPKHVQLRSSPQPASYAYTTIRVLTGVHSSPVGAYSQITIARAARVTNSRHVVRAAVVATRFYTRGALTAPQDYPLTGLTSGPGLAYIALRPSALLQGRVPPLSGLYSTRLRKTLDIAAPAVQESSNPADLFLDFARGEYMSADPTPGAAFDGNDRLTAASAGAVLKWGCGLSDEQIDLVGLDAWAAFCRRERLECNLVLRNVSRQEALQTIAATGRATLTWHTGKLGVVFDDRRAPSYVFGRGNILPDTYSIAYAPADAADEISARWTSADNDYQERSYRALRPGVTGAPARTAEVRLIGITRDDQARREVRRQAAAQSYHRARYMWETSEEGLLVERGDVVLLPSHIGEWDSSGHLAGVNDDGAAVTLAAPVTVADGTASLWVGIRCANGYVHETAATVEPGAVSELRLAAALPERAGLPPATDDDSRAARAAAIAQAAYLMQAIPLDESRRAVKITEIRPLGGNRVRIVARPEDPRYYDAAEIYDTIRNVADTADESYTWNALLHRSWNEWDSWIGGPRRPAA